MRYINNGYEIPYRECQILREAAIDILNKEGAALNRFNMIKNLNKIASQYEMKSSCCSSLRNFLIQMEEDDFNFIKKFIMGIVKNQRGIQIMVPFMLDDNKIVLVVPAESKYLDKVDDDILDDIF